MAGNSDVRTVRLPSGEQVSQLGQGTWQMAEDRSKRASEIAALRAGLDLGLSLIDTAEMYGEGAAEELVAEAIAGRRAEAFLVSKVYPHNASRKGVVSACERSLSRLKTDCIDLYLLHWMGRHPLAETVEGFEKLQQAGKIRHWGVSNLDAGDMQALWDVEGGGGVAANQVLYNLTRRAADWELLPWQRERHIPLMAYSPVEQSRLISNAKLVRFAKDHAATPAQIALAWLMAKDDVIVIPKAGRVRSCGRKFQSARPKAHGSTTQRARWAISRPSGAGDAGRALARETLAFIRRLLSQGNVFTRETLVLQRTEKTMSETNPQEHLYDLLKDFSTAMLVSADQAGRMHARPMAIADLKPDADAYFATNVQSPKVSEIQNFPDVLISFQSATQFASVAGKATIVKDRSLIDKLWSETWRVWFPGGKDDPNLVLIKVEAREGEFWDNSGTHGLSYAFEGLKAVLKGTTPASDKGGSHGKIRLVSG